MSSAEEQDATKRGIILQQGAGIRCSLHYHCPSCYQIAGSIEVGEHTKPGNGENSSDCTGNGG